MLYGRYSFSSSGLKPFTPEGTFSIPIEQTEKPASLILRVYDLEDFTDIDEDHKSILELWKSDAQTWVSMLTKSKFEKRRILDVLCSEELVQKEGNQYSLSISDKNRIIDMLKEAGFSDSESTATQDDKDRIKACFKRFTHKP